jgi:zinc transport system permease protein
MDDFLIRATAAGSGLLVLALVWNRLLTMTVHEELAAVDGVNVAATRLVFMLLIAFVIAAAMKVVGVLLIVSLLIIPAAAARRFAATPEQMAALSALAGCISVVAGLSLSATADTPAGASIVAAATVLFFLSLISAHRAV